MVVTPVIQLNETTFVRTVSLNPITTFDTGNYSCVAVVQGAYHTSGVAFLNTSLVVQRKFSYNEYIIIYPTTYSFALYNRWGLTVIFSLPGGYKGKYEYGS